ncbi:hypothetical protein BDQ12DRAFT_744206 [Crucibulum laeve]|uniref:Uncharacterized protein n=1 Tax=Crucibulum laeve TaxID=68775 RepID=A0A5C3LGS5_9AGAR|nr:hypothetical protein BDQ12DRAFT_744206 [Crucibulum laeve]
MIAVPLMTSLAKLGAGRGALSCSADASETATARQLLLLIRKASLVIMQEYIQEFEKRVGSDRVLTRLYMKGSKRSLQVTNINIRRSRIVAPNVPKKALASAWILNAICGSNQIHKEKQAQHVDVPCWLMLILDTSKGVFVKRITVMEYLVD